MIRRLNYTNRIKIRRADIRVFLRKSAGVSSFKAELELDSYKIHDDAMVFIEAYRLTTRMRFCFGTVGKLQTPVDTALANFDTPDGILFQVKVTTAGTDHILFAEADQIPLIDPDDKEISRLGLLAVMSDDLGDEVWRVNYEGQRPMLIINTKVGDWKGVARSNYFFSLVYPAIVRETLTRILFIEKYEDEEDPEDWKAQWLKFAQTFTETKRPSLKEDNETITEWINDIAQKFSTQARSCDKFIELEARGSK